MSKLLNAIGLMSGTSCDGVDLSYIASDGRNIIKHKGSSFIEYDVAFKKRLQNLLQGNQSLLEIKAVENELTRIHGDLVNNFLEENKIAAQDIDVVGFHGQTILHKPSQGITWQLYNADLLQKITNIQVIANFRNPDIAAGGQGAPLAPIYHFYLMQEKLVPTLILNIGGISNITYFASQDENSLQAFDICYGNALSDDLVKKHKNIDYDLNGQIAMTGQVDFALAGEILQNQIFHKEPVKSFDRFDFHQIMQPINDLKLEDALASLAYILAKVLKINIEKFITVKPQRIIICGGGRKNQAIFNEVKKQLEDTEVLTAEDSKLNGDYIESEAFAFLAIRKILNLPISFSKTTGVNL